MGAGALVDLNLEGGENRIDIDLYGDADPSKSAAAGVDFVMDKQADSGESTGTEEALQGGDEPLDFVLDSPERGDDSPTHEMPRRGDETTIETEIARTRETPTLESPAMLTAELSGVRQQIESKLAGPGVEQTAELALDDLGLDLHGLEDSSVPTFDNSNSNLQKTGHPLEATDHPSDAPTMIAGLDERSRRLMEEAEARVRDRDLTELERELEASFIAELDAGHTQAGIKTAILGPESAPTLQMPRRDDAATTNTARLRALELSDRVDVNSTSRLRGLDEHSIDLDLDKLASALGSGDTVEQPRAADEVFSTEVFDSSRRDQKVDLDVGVPLQSSDQSPTSTAVIEAKDTAQLPELEPVTMSEVGTKLDLARAYMDMGDPEGARSILDEVISEGSASQKQEAQRLIESLPG
jgi:pilus assembly protein FimV